MKKRELLIIAILLLSLWVNFTTLNKVEEQTNQMGNLRNLLDQQNNQMTHTTNQINQMVAEKEWIQKSNFSLVKEESREEHMVVRGEFTFNEMNTNQKPAIFHRETGTSEWAKSDLKSLGGLNYAVAITLSPEKVYEYQITAEGDVSKGSTILRIPQQIYGFPEKKVDISTAPVKNSETRTVQAYVGFAPAPMDEMTPVSVTLQIEKEGQLIKIIPLTNKSALNSEFSGTWEMSNQDELEMSPDTELLIVTEFKNGVVIKEKTNVVIHDGNQASQRVISEVKK